MWLRRDGSVGGADVTDAIGDGIETAGFLDIPWGQSYYTVAGERPSLTPFAARNATNRSATGLLGYFALADYSAFVWGTACPPGAAGHHRHRVRQRVERAEAHLLCHTTHHGLVHDRPRPRGERLPTLRGLPLPGAGGHWGRAAYHRTKIPTLGDLNPQGDLNATLTWDRLSGNSTLRGPSRAVL